MSHGFTRLCQRDYTLEAVIYLKLFVPKTLKAESWLFFIPKRLHFGSRVMIWIVCFKEIALDNLVMHEKLLNNKKNVYNKSFELFSDILKFLSKVVCTGI